MQSLACYVEFQTNKHEVLTDFKKCFELDTILFKHCTNVGIYSKNFIKKISHKIDEELMINAGIFHDIGKTKIDKAILEKPSILTSEEFSKMKRHTFYGYNILRSKAFPNEVVVSAQLHHEKFDGSGYPLGLKGEEIPIMSRIISICDVFSALTEDRPYRTAHSVDEALTIMINQRESFDPSLLSIFISNINQIIE